MNWVMHMAQSLSRQDIEKAKSYIVWRTLSKALRKDLETLKDNELALSAFYLNLLETFIHLADHELTRLNRQVIQIQKTDQPTVWKVKIGSRTGYVEVNAVEILLELRDQIVFKTPLQEKSM